MKKMYLIINRLQQYYHRNKVIFLFFVIGGIVNAIMLCFFYGNLLPTVSGRNSQDVAYRIYSIRFEDTAYGDYQKLETLDDDPLISAISAKGSFPGNQTEIFRTYQGNYSVVLITGRGILTSPNQIIVPYTCSTPVGEKLTLRGRSFEIVGKSTDSDVYTVHPQVFKELGIPQRITGMEVIAAQRQNETNDPVLSKITAAFPNAASIRNGLYQQNRYNQEIADHYSLQILINYLLITVSYMFLLRYLIRDMIHENIISAFVGASKKDITVLVFLETTVLSAAVGGIGLLLHRLLYIPVFTKLNVVKDLQYSIRDYLLLYLFLLVVSVAVSLPLAARYLRMSPVSAKREHT